MNEIVNKALRRALKHSPNLDPEQVRAPHPSLPAPRHLVTFGARLPEELCREVDNSRGDVSRNFFMAAALESSVASMNLTEAYRQWRTERNPGLRISIAAFLERHGGNEEPEEWDRLPEGWEQSE